MANTLLILRFVMAALLYAFLGVVVYLISRDLRERAREESPAFQSATLITEKDSASAQAFSLRPITAIGRAQDNHLKIDDPFASANHAIIAWREDHWWIEDLESHNGTYLNGDRIGKPRPLAPGDRIGIGETTLRFELDGGSDGHPRPGDR